MSQEDINRRFDHHPPKDPEVVNLHVTARSEIKLAAELFDEILPEGREKSLALTKLEEALMWANAAIARK